ncbi:MAG TPA: vWA domain-containing protein [Candidatus Limnocylindria bacterium]
MVPASPFPSGTRRRAAALPAALLLTFAMAGAAAADNPATGTTTTDQQLSVSVSTDAAADPVWLGTTVLADANATLGEGDTANIIYTVDVSGSMENPDFNPPQPSVGDCDGDGNVGTALDAACVGLIALNASLGSASNLDIGLVAFGDGAKTADMDPAAGAQTFTSPPDADNDAAGGADVEQVIHSLSTEFGGSSSGGIGQFTSDITAGFAGLTNYDAALTNMNAAFAGNPADVNTGFFLSDGLPNLFSTGAGSPLQAAIDAGTVIHTFGIGGGAPNACNPGAPLRTIADSTGGTCTAVADPSTLSTVLPATLTNIASLELTVNGVSVASTSGSEPLAMSLTGVDITSALVVGMNTIQATATAEDGTEVTAETTLGVVDLDLSPASATNELSTTDTHTVVATVSGDPTQVAAIPVSFAVTGQNAGAIGTCSPASCQTDASGQVSFTYSVPVAPASLGTDTITAVATIDAGSQTRTATKQWVDTTPPVSTCTEGVNPAGHTPRAGQHGPGQNEDGFYLLGATDVVDPDLTLWLVDTGSGTVFGPFESGTNIKYVQAPGAAPSQRAGSGAVDWFIKGTGDAAVYAVDGSGNTSALAACLVPPPPK